MLLVSHSTFLPSRLCRLHKSRCSNSGHFRDNLTGFDVVRFDAWLKLPEGVSTRDYVREHYGEEAVSLILALL